MKISFILTVLNEEKTIDKFLKSLEQQTKRPDEMIIVDGGSTDKTVNKIKNKIEKVKKKTRFNLITKEGNRSVGRNEAIRNASGDIIVVTDAGCIPDKNWIKNIIVPFIDSEIDVVAGYYHPKTSNIFEKCLATYTCVMPDQIDPKNFLPSSRSIAFRKNIWERNKYPQWLDTCEDLYFVRELNRKGFKFVFAGNAIVFWPQRKNIREAFWQFFNYALGDGTARYFRKSTPFLFGRYVLGAVLFLIYLYTHSLLLFVFIIVLLGNYISWAILKNYRFVNHREAYFYLPLLQLTSDIAVLLGTALGFIRGLFIKR